MTDQHPITPPPELVYQWIENAIGPDYEQVIATQAARWGADQELEAGVNYIDNNISGNKAREYRAIRRPKPPSLKEQALATLQRVSKDQYPCNYQDDEDWDTIRRALEALPE